MKIYFSVSISQLNEEIKNNCSRIIDILKKNGHSVFPEDLLLKNMRTIGSQSEDEALIAQKKLTSFKKSCDLVLIEATNQSLGIGQEIALSLSLNKPVIILYSGDRVPHILKDEGKDYLEISKYNKDDLESVLGLAIDFASSHQDTRFNFFVSPKHVSFLDWVAKTKKIPRSVYLRRLIEEEIEKDNDYK